LAKNVFRPTEVVNLTSAVQVEAPRVVDEEPEVIDEIPEYTGPTADDLRREAEAFKVTWATEKAQMIERATREADEIVKDAETRAFEEVRKQTEAAQHERQAAEEEVREIVGDAEEQAAKLVRDAEGHVETLTEQAKKEGFERGHEDGYASGKDEVERLIDQIHSVISHSIEKRNEIIEESETQLVNLVLLIARKVVKVISENQRNVVINNVIQALRKLKSRGEVVIRVNLADVKLTSAHVKDFMRMVENVKSVTVVEDSTVDRGGCIIETDFGQIDARISSQLREIEEKIIELAPIKVRGEAKV
jgi:flagellar assembly protein FliH